MKSNVLIFVKNLDTSLKYWYPLSIIAGVLQHYVDEYHEKMMHDADELIQRLEILLMQNPKITEIGKYLSKYLVLT